MRCSLHEKFIFANSSLQYANAFIMTDNAYLSPAALNTHQLGAWIPLMNANRQNGCMQVIMVSFSCTVLPCAFNVIYFAFTDKLWYDKLLIIYCWWIKLTYLHAEGQSRGQNRMLDIYFCFGEILVPLILNKFGAF